MKTFGFLAKIFLIILLISINPLSSFSRTHFLEPKSQEDNLKVIDLAIGSAEVLISDSPIDKVAIVDPFIVDGKLIEDTEMLIRSKQIGQTDMLVWEAGDPQPSKYTFNVIPDLSSLNDELKRIDPRIKYSYIPANRTTISNISLFQDENAPKKEEASLFGAQLNLGNEESFSAETRVEQGRIILTGQVKDAESVADAVMLAAAYMNDTGIEILSRKGGQLNAQYQNQNQNQNLNQGGQGQNQNNAGGATGGGNNFFVGSQNFNYSNWTYNLHRSSIVASSNRKVISYLEIDSKQQISIAIKFFEITKNLTRRLDSSFQINGARSNFLSRLSQGEIPIVSQTLDFNDVKVFLDYLEARGEARALAEPTLVVTSGEPASFLAGGEAPVLVSIATGAQAQQNVRFEAFGIKLSILPTLINETKVHMHVIPEIRNIDRALTDFFTSSGGETVRPPAFATRRTETQVELAMGQSLILSGLLDSTLTQDYSKLPGVGSIPILGDLFKSKQFQQGETELFVMITPEFTEDDYVVTATSSKIFNRSKEFKDMNHMRRRTDIGKDSTMLFSRDTVIEPEPETNEDEFEYEGIFTPVDESNEDIGNSYWRSEAEPSIPLEPRIDSQDRKISKILESLHCCQGTKI